MSNDPFFLVGCPRSGTSLLASMVSSHPDVAVMGETHFVPILTRLHRSRLTSSIADRRRAGLIMRNGRVALSGLTRTHVAAAVADSSSLSESLSALYRIFGDQQGKTCVGDKTPSYVKHISLLSDLFPDARFVHIVRDPRSVAASLLKRSWGPTTVEGAGLFWKQHVRSGQRQGSVLGSSRYLEITYESLVDRPEDVLGEVARLLGVGFSDQMLDFAETGREYAARNFDPSIHARLSDELMRTAHDLSSDEVRLLEAMVGPEMQDSGYELEFHPSAPTTVQAIRAHADVMKATSPITVARLRTLAGQRL